MVVVVDNLATVDCSWPRPSPLPPTGKQFRNPLFYLKILPKIAKDTDCIMRGSSVPEKG